MTAAGLEGGPAPNSAQLLGLAVATERAPR
jgi:hypothetical protein